MEREDEGGRKRKEEGGKEGENMYKSQSDILGKNIVNKKKTKIIRHIKLRRVVSFWVKQKQKRRAIRHRHSSALC